MIFFEVWYFDGEEWKAGATFSNYGEARMFEMEGLPGFAVRREIKETKIIAYFVGYREPGCQSVWERKPMKWGVEEK